MCIRDRYQVGFMYGLGHDVAVDYQQARAWFEKAAAQDDPIGVRALGQMYYQGKGVISSYCRARELFERAIELGCTGAVERMQVLNNDIQEVRTTCIIIPRIFITPRIRGPPTAHALALSLAPSHVQNELLMDKRVEIHGTSRADMNGKRGVATDYHFNPDMSKQRYTVQLDSGEAFKLKPANVRVEGTGGASGGGKAKMGKGKKCRGGRS